MSENSKSLMDSVSQLLFWTIECVFQVAQLNMIGAQSKPVSDEYKIVKHIIEDLSNTQIYTSA